MLASISKKLFEKVQDKIETNKQRKSRKKNLDDVAFLLSESTTGFLRFLFVQV